MDGRGHRNFEPIGGERLNSSKSAIPQREEEPFQAQTKEKIYYLMEQLRTE